MTFPMLLAFLAALWLAAVAADMDDRRRARYDALDEAADLCRGAQPDNTPEMRKAPPVAPAEARIRNTASQQH
ncbi:hypothetical protein [Tsukamurella spumae]|uniref:Secreted protein n=1 Tax=Tsukamurella spumae TaxID=44753 RepID=A0A846WWH8_9ACTN|nr:hypothetical protein [Tsukamurella spumae]NKY17518.1 hypothetical protein [Tsukamurella spumae]